MDWLYILIVMMVRQLNTLVSHAEGSTEREESLYGFTHVEPKE